jgi:hypothetical protein
MSTTTAPALAPANILKNAAAEIEARVQHLSDDLLDANVRVAHYRDWLTNATARRDRLQYQLDAAHNALQHLSMILPTAAAAVASHPLAAVLVDAAA